MLFLCGELGSLLSFFFLKSRQISLTQLMFVSRQLKNRPDLSSSNYRLNASLTPQEAKLIYRDSFSHLAKVVYESLVFRRVLKTSAGELYGLVPNRKHIITDDQEFIREICAGDTPMMGLSGHIGSFEILAAYYGSIAKSLNIIARKPNQTVLSLILDDLRQGYNAHPLWRNDPTAAIKLVRIFKGNGTLAVLIDQDTALKNEFIPFFGLEAAYPKALIETAVRLNVSIYTSFIIRESNFCHRIITKPIPYNDKDPMAIRKILETYSHRLEELICQYPEQWVWWHRRWRRRPNIAYDQKTIWPPNTKEYLQWLEQQ